MEKNAVTILSNKSYKTVDLCDYNYTKMCTCGKSLEEKREKMRVKAGHRVSFVSFNTLIMFYTSITLFSLKKFFLKLEVHDKAMSLL